MWYPVVNFNKNMVTYHIPNFVRNCSPAVLAPNVFVFVFFNLD